MNQVVHTHDRRKGRVIGSEQVFEEEMCANDLLPAACRHSVCIKQQPLKRKVQTSSFA